MRLREEGTQPSGTTFLEDPLFSIHRNPSYCTCLPSIFRLHIASCLEESLEQRCQKKGVRTITMVSFVVGRRYGCPDLESCSVFDILRRVASSSTTSNHSRLNLVWEIRDVLVDIERRKQMLVVCIIQLNQNFGLPHVGKGPAAHN